MSPSDREENHYEKPSITIPALDKRPIRSQFKDDSIISLLLRWADCSRTAASAVKRARIQRWSLPESQRRDQMVQPHTYGLNNAIMHPWGNLAGKELPDPVCEHSYRCLYGMWMKLQCNQLNESELFTEPCGHIHYTTDIHNHNSVFGLQHTHRDRNVTAESSL